MFYYVITYLYSSQFKEGILTPPPPPQKKKERSNILFTTFFVDLYHYVNIFL